MPRKKASQTDNSAESGCKEKTTGSQERSKKISTPIHSVSEANKSSEEGKIGEDIIPNMSASPSSNVNPAYESDADDFLADALLKCVREVNVKNECLKG